MEYSDSLLVADVLFCGRSILPADEEEVSSNFLKRRKKFNKIIKHDKTSSDGLGTINHGEVDFFKSKMNNTFYILPIFWHAI